MIQDFVVELWLNNDGSPPIEMICHPVVMLTGYPGGKCVGFCPVGDKKNMFLFEELDAKGITYNIFQGCTGVPYDERL